MHAWERRTIQKKILAWYEDSGRHELPWRLTSDVYAIAVAEIMLQQTNVAKVVPLYKNFLARFPSWQALADASQADVLTAWRGLGYNRRARNLYRSAQIVVRDYGNSLPLDRDRIQALPGFGPYTTHAVMAFAYNADVAAVDVNIARLMERWGALGALSTDVQSAADAMLLRGESCVWHSALMDFASAVCTKRSPQCATCPLRRMCPSYPQPRDEVIRKRKEPGRMECGKYIPRRIYRGRIIEVLRRKSLTVDEIGQRIKVDWNADTDGAWLENILERLCAEELVVVREHVWRLR